MERLLQSSATPGMREEAESLGIIARSRGPAWQRLAVLEDQLLERLITMSSLPWRGTLPEQTELPEPHVAQEPAAPAPAPPPPAPAQLRVNLSPRRDCSRSSVVELTAAGRDGHRVRRYSLRFRGR
jgi:hypothetical protein